MTSGGHVTCIVSAIQTSVVLVLFACYISMISCSFQWLVVIGDCSDFRWGIWTSTPATQTYNRRNHRNHHCGLRHLPHHCGCVLLFHEWLRCTHVSSATGLRKEVFCIQRQNDGGRRKVSDKDWASFIVIIWQNSHFRKLLPCFIKCRTEDTNESFKLQNQNL